MRIPQPVMLETKIFEAIASFIVIGHHFRRPGAEVLDTADFDALIVDINPVIVKGVAILQNEHDGEEVAVLERFARTFRSFRYGRRKSADDLAHGRRRNYVLGFERLHIALPIFKRDPPSGGWLVIFAADNFAAHFDLAAHGLRLLRTNLPHHSGTFARITK